MADKSLSAIAGASGLPRLAPDLLYPENRTNLQINTFSLINLNASAGLTTALSLTGKYSVSLLQFSSVNTENMTVKLTIDGVVIWNSTFTAAGTTQTLLGTTATTGTQESIQCNSSLLLEVQMTADTSIDLLYLARPIL